MITASGWGWSLTGVCDLDFCRVWCANCGCSDLDRFRETLKNGRMERESRHKVIMRAIDRPGEMRIRNLAELTGVAAVTIRRDLAELEELGLLVRTHGGARRVERRGTPKPFRVRQAEDPEAKAAIARAASELIGDDDAVIFDNGTTAQAIAQRLAGRPITAMCLSLHSAAALGVKPGANIFVPGGEVEPDTLALSSVAVASALREFRADVVVLGSCSTSLEHGLATTTYDDAENKRAAMRAATRRILAVAPRKLNHVSTFRFGDIEDLHQLVTTTDAPAEILAQIRELGVHVITVPAGK